MSRAVRRRHTRSQMLSDAQRAHPYQCPPCFLRLSVDHADLGTASTLSYMRLAGATDAHRARMMALIGENVVLHLSRIAHQYRHVPDDMLSDERFDVLAECACLPVTDRTDKGPHYTAQDLNRLVEGMVLFDPTSGIPIGQCLEPDQVDTLMGPMCASTNNDDPVVALLRTDCHLGCSSSADRIINHTSIDYPGPRHTIACATPAGLGQVDFECADVSDTPLSLREVLEKQEEDAAPVDAILVTPLDGVSGLVVERQ